jgi:hypothetical protein
MDTAAITFSRPSGLGFSQAEAGARVDREAGVIRGVAVITEGEAKGHGVKIDAETVRQVYECAKTYPDGLKVQQDHGSGVMAAVGVLRGLRIDGTILRADLYPLRTYEHREKLFDMAETMPGNFGLSIYFSGVSEMKAGERFARCSEIYSADLVSEPAANPSGLFSRQNPNPTQFTMTTEDLIKAVADLREEMGAKFSALEGRLSKFENPEAKPEDEAMSALKAQVTALAAKVEDKTALAATLAAEFAKVRGPVAAPSPAGDTNTGPDEAQAFADAVTKFKADLPASRKADAYSMAARQNPQGYAAFTAAQKAGRTFKL